jgi:hypothetical protein
MWLILGFVALGLLVGNLVGMTSESAVTPTLSLLFSAAGGSIVVLLHKVPETERKILGKLLLALSISCLFGIFDGIVVTEHRLLSPRSATRAQSDTKYLRSMTSKEIDAIDIEYKSRAISAGEAYSRLYALAKKEEQ